MTIKGKGAYAGKHWMQDPANKEKMLKMVRKMQIGSKRARKAGTYKRGKNVRHESVLREVAHDIVRVAKKSKSVIHSKEMILIINGWRVTLSKDTVRIDND